MFNPVKARWKNFIKNIDGKDAINLLANWFYYMLQVYEQQLIKNGFEIGKIMLVDRTIIYGELGIYVIDLKRYVTYEKIDSIEFLQVTTNINLKNGSVLKSNYNEKSIYNEHEKSMIQRIKEELAKRLNDNCIYNIDEIINTLYYSDQKYVRIVKSV